MTSGFASDLTLILSNRSRTGVPSNHSSPKVGTCLHLVFVENRRHWTIPFGLDLVSTNDASAS